MSPSKPPREVIDAEVDAGGLLHVGVLLAQAFGGEDQPVLHPRAYLMKCDGAPMPACSTCIRKLAPSAGAGQRWTSCDLDSAGRCYYFASIDVYSDCYAAPEVSTEDAAKSDVEHLDRGQMARDETGLDERHVAGLGGANPNYESETAR